MTKTSPSQRQQIRKKFLDLRSNLSAARKNQGSAAICKHLQIFFAKKIFTSPEKKVAKRIAAYLNSAPEASVDAWMNHEWQRSQLQIFIPVLDQQQQGQMSFRGCHKNSRISIGRFGLRTLAEPKAAEQIDAADLDCVLLPMVAFDKYGTRLGMGGGYYDRFFANQTKRPYLLGISFDAQMSQQVLDRSPWDVGLDAVITESGLTEFDSNK